ncbi:hypothetical protein [Streptomyces roseicoloratus]|uniref:hypothetical protein n=1 Tax=Streptomyces roseicoloratus TaxID=2508722 RepID=UPI001009B435|nr:hypothetical protein [Streptomyces roseicoloratus]
MTTEQQPDVVAGEQPSKLAGGCVLAIGAALAGGIAYTVPETAYYTAGLLTAAGVRRARTWAAGRRGGEQPEVEDAVDIVAALHELSPGGTANVRLTQLAEGIGLPDTRTVRALLDEASIPIKEVRTGGKVGPGIHVTAIPRSCGAPPDGCWCAVTSNNNTNNTPEEEPREGFRVEHIGHAGTVVHDPAETRRRHATTTRSAR